MPLRRWRVVVLDEAEAAVVGLALVEGEPDASGVRLRAAAGCVSPVPLLVVPVVLVELPVEGSISGWAASTDSGIFTPSIACRSSHTLATERAAWVSSARSAAARAVGLIRPNRRSVDSSSRSPVVSTGARRAAIARAVRAALACTWAGELSVQPVWRQ